jgi:hypothetical protein
MIDPHLLDEILEVLQDRGVSSFACPEFSVSLTPAVRVDNQPIREAIAEGNEAAKRPLARGVFGHPSLWPSGVPQFPGSEK